MPGSVFWSQGRSIDRCPLVRHINEQFRTVESISDYELMVRSEPTAQGAQPRQTDQ